MSRDEVEYWQEVAYEFGHNGPPCPGDDLDDETAPAPGAPCAPEPDLTLGFRWVR